MKKLIAMLMALMMCSGMFTSCASGDSAADSYTYNGAVTALGSNWNPHTWETAADSAVNDYITSPFVAMSVRDSENGVYQWVYEMADAITDVTAEHREDLTRYAVILPEGRTPETIDSGYVFEFSLNPDAKWEDGTPINADSYIYSMKQLLAPEMHNYRANLYIAGESALAGAEAYYNSGAPVYAPMTPPYETEGDYSYDLEKGISDGLVYVNVNSSEITLSDKSLAELNSAYGMGFDAEIGKLADDANAYGYTRITAENRAAAETLIHGLLTGVFGITDESDLENRTKEALWVDTETGGETVDYDSTVGCYKADDYTIRYVCRTAIDFNYFLTSCTGNWLVYEPLYEAGKDSSGKLVTTNYGTSPETTMSCGPYKLESLQTDRQMVFTRNENWYGWEEEEGGLVSYTDFEVDGEKRQQYQTTRIVIDVMEESAMKQAFLKGQLTEWSPAAEELTAYAASDQLYRVDETYTMSFFFNTDTDMLKAMDKTRGNINSVVLSDTNFRKAFSQAIDRAEFVTATPGYKPAFTLMNNLYFYDIYNDPESSYRNSEEGMRAVCSLYDVEYGEGRAYETLREAYNSVTGFNLTEARALMKSACGELTAAGLYRAGEDIVIRIAWSKAALQSSDNNQIALLNRYINEAAEGSGFGKITLEGIGSVEDRYGDVPAGEYAVGYGAWGGAAFYPFRNMQVYCDNLQYGINEAACWDPSAEQLTLNVEGEDVTMSWQEWSNALIGTGRFAESDSRTKLAVTARLEELYLKKYYRIPVCSTTTCSVLSYKNSYYTEDYNIMYGFGGMRLMSYNYTDTEWEEFVADQGGILSYE